MLFTPTNQGGSGRQGRASPTAESNAAGRDTGADTALGRARGAPGAAPGVAEGGLLQGDRAQEWTGQDRQGSDRVSRRLQENPVVIVRRASYQSCSGSAKASEQVVGDTATEE